MTNYNTKEEIWKDVEGYEGLYQVSTFGRVRSLDRTTSGRNGCTRNIKGKILSELDNKGYKVVGLHKEGSLKKVLISRLVANCFVANEFNKPEVNHIDEDKNNNRADNLEWVTAKENSNHGTRNDRISKYVKANQPWKNRVYGTGGEYQGDKKRWKNILQIDAKTNEVIAEFTSVKEALVAVGAGPKAGTLSSCLTGNGRNKTFKGYKWEYKN